MDPRSVGGPLNKPGSQGSDGPEWSSGPQYEAGRRRAFETGARAHQGPRGCSVRALRAHTRAFPGSAWLSRNAGALKGAVLGEGTHAHTPVEGACRASPSNTPGKISVLGSSWNSRNWKTPGSAEARIIQRNRGGLGSGQRVRR